MPGTLMLGVVSEVGEVDVVVNLPNGLTGFIKGSAAPPPLQLTITHCVTKFYFVKFPYTIVIDFNCVPDILKKRINIHMHTIRLNTGGMFFFPVFFNSYMVLCKVLCSPFSSKDS